MHCTLENWTGFWLAAERILYCQYCFLSTVIELYQDILMKCLSLHSAGVYKITDCFGHKFEENKYRGNKDYLLLGQKCAPVKIVLKMLQHCLLLCMLVTTMFYFICKANPNNWSILSFDSLIVARFFSHLCYPFNMFTMFWISFPAKLYLYF